MSISTSPNRGPVKGRARALMAASALAIVLSPPSALAQTSDTAAARSGAVLPRPPAPFQGRIGFNAQDSTPDWPKPVTAPAGAPNVLLILTDDVGFAASSAFGGPIPTPNLDRLAAHGLKYNEFHTTALCSPTRAALLTGRNHHAVSTGTVIDLPSGYPGYWSVIPKSAATVAEVLKDNGYNTAMFGKHHNTPAWLQSTAGPFDSWPNGLGFEYFYGFMGGDNNQWQPRLYRNTVPVDDQTHDSGETLDHELADNAIHWIHQQKAAGPDKPFFVYYAPGSAHAPHQAPTDWIARFKGQFDQGWDKLREESFARQKRLGVIPADAVLTPRPKQLPAWDSLSPDEKRLDARFMEVYAAMLAHQDHEIGRVIDELQRMGQLDNTLVIFIEGDNGASGEGSPNGTLNEIGRLANGAGSDPARMLRDLDQLGGPHTYELYPAGWAWALNTPFQWMKQVASHLGGIRNGAVISWPARIKDVGQVRSQFAHVTDIAPTILAAAGLSEPEVVNGVKQQPVDGVPLEYSFDSATAPTRHGTQYFEMAANRAIYQDGWIANTIPRRMPWEAAPPPGVKPSDYTWELYDLNHDYSQSHDVAAEQPQKLKALQALWLQEANRNNVLPLDDRLSGARALNALAVHTSKRTDFTYWGKGLSVAEGAAPSFLARSFSVTAKITVPTSSATGALVARGSWFGGWSFYLKDGRPAAIEAVDQEPEDQFKVEAAAPIPPGPATVRYDFERQGFAVQAGGLLRISVNGQEVARGRIGRTILAPGGIGETFDVGQDTGAPVTSDYPVLGRYPGDINEVEVSLGPVAWPLANAAARAAATTEAHTE